MSLDIRRATQAQLGVYDKGASQTNWGECIVTAIAASFAVLIVVIIAVLMGMT